MTTSATALLITSDDEDVSAVEEDLLAAGFEIRRCHEGGERFPCTGIAGGECPLDVTGGVDVAVDVRQHPWPDPTALEVGVTCALRAGVPVVVVGRRGHPFEAWATASVDGVVGIGRRCVEAMDEALVPHHDAALAAVRAVFTNHGLADAPAGVVVSRRRGRLHVTITADAPPLVRGLAVTRAASAVRHLDPAATAIEIDFAQR